MYMHSVYTFRIYIRAYRRAPSRRSLLDRIATLGHCGRSATPHQFAGPALPASAWCTIAPPQHGLTVSRPSLALTVVGSDGATIGGGFIGGGAALGSGAESHHARALPRAAEDRSRRVRHARWLGHAALPTRVRWHDAQCGGTVGSRLSPLADRAWIPLFVPPA
jgi:hypothetical protein